MTQTLAIFYDAYRSLHAKKMFWVVLVISLLVVAVFACIGVNEDGVKILFWQFDNGVIKAEGDSGAEMFYREIVFRQLGINVWLSWIATILALVSTVGIFPDLVNSGSIDLLVSKPIGRLRLFLTQYVAGLLFVTLQVAIFCAACFLLIGLRAGHWEPRLFMAVPIVVCLFSYLFAFSVLVGVLTRSTLAALLLTLLLWMTTFGLWYVGHNVLTFKAMNEARLSMQDLQRVSWGGGRPAVLSQTTESAEDAAANEADFEDAAGKLGVALGVIDAISAPLPKPLETKGLLGRVLSDEDRPEPPQEPTVESTLGEKMAWMQWRIVDQSEYRSLWWILGTSLAFEFVSLSLAAWIFCRRDY